MSISIKKEVPEYFKLARHASSIIKTILPSPDKVSYTAAELVVLGVYQGLEEVTESNPGATPELAVTRLLEAEEAIRTLYTVYTAMKCFNITLDGWATVVCGVDAVEQAIIIAQLEAIIHNRPYRFVGYSDVTCKAGA